MKWFLLWALTASLLILALLLIRRLARRKASARAIYALWLFAALRLLIPGSISVDAPSVAAAPVQPQQPTAATHQAAYQATYGAPQQVAAAPQAPTAAATPGTVPTASPHAAAAATAAAVQKTRKTIDPEQVFRICGMIVGAVIIVFGLCMLAYYTPDDVSSLFDTYQMNGSAGFASAGATSAQVLKAGFSMLLIGFGATDICAFGAKYMKAKKREQK